MADRYQQLMGTPIGKIVSKQVGLPTPIKIDRYEPGQPVIDGPVLFGAAPGGRLAGPVAKVLAAVGADVHTPPDHDVRGAAPELHANVWDADVAPSEQTFKALVFDAGGIGCSEQLRELWAFFTPTIRRVRRSGRVIVLGTPPEACDGPRQAIAQRALEGFTRAVGKEVRRGCTAQLVYVAPAGEDQIESTLRFLLSSRSAYVSGQVIRVGPATTARPRVGAATTAGPATTAREPLDWEHPLGGRVALVTGASRGIGAAIAKVLARDGAHVVGLDLPAQARDLDALTAALGGSSLTLDITGPGTPAEIADYLLERHGGADVVVHNAGAIRDKTLGRMPEELWNLVLDINLEAPQRIDRELFARHAIRDDGRIVGISSISGIAGNVGQTNYATAKAGVIGFVQAWAPIVQEQGVTINAVAPGFIETQMTAAMPIAAREAGRRMNSLAQGGLPVDVAETVAWLASPASGGVTGNVVRVCGQSLIGA